MAARCQVRMESLLRAPSTADFPPFSFEHVQRLSPTQFRMVSYVDAQNAFGGTVRAGFRCEVTGSGEDVAGYRVTDFVTE